MSFANRNLIAPTDVAVNQYRCARRPLRAPPWSRTRARTSLATVAWRWRDFPSATATPRASDSARRRLLANPRETVAIVVESSFTSRSNACSEATIDLSAGRASLATGTTTSCSEAFKVYLISAASQREDRGADRYMDATRLELDKFYPVVRFRQMRHGRKELK